MAKEDFYCKQIFKLRDLVKLKDEEIKNLKDQLNLTQEEGDQRMRKLESDIMEIKKKEESANHYNKVMKEEFEQKNWEWKQKQVKMDQMEEENKTINKNMLKLEQKIREVEQKKKDKVTENKELWTMINLHVENEEHIRQQTTYIKTREQKIEKEEIKFQKMKKQSLNKSREIKELNSQIKKFQDNERKLQLQLNEKTNMVANGNRNSHSRFNFRFLGNGPDEMMNNDEPAKKRSKLVVPATKVSDKPNTALKMPFHIKAEVGLIPGHTLDIVDGGSGITSGRDNLGSDQYTPESPKDSPSFSSSSNE